MLQHPRRAATKLATAAATVAMLTAGVATAAAAQTRAAAHPAFHARAILAGRTLHHRFRAAGSATWHTERLSLPDDITALGPALFTAFQNGVGPQGQAAPDGNRDSTVVEFTANGHPRAPVGHPRQMRRPDRRPAHRPGHRHRQRGRATPACTPSTRRPAQVRHYHYSRPLPHHGGTDAISIYRGQVLISASAPGTTGRPRRSPATRPSTR